jgi:hypothetical protein
VRPLGHHRRADHHRAGIHRGTVRRLASTRGAEFRNPPRSQAGRLNNELMAKYDLNESAVVRARELIDARQYVLDSDWGEVQPGADVQNAYLEAHDWDDYARWHLGLTEGAKDDTKARYAFVYGDFRRIHRTGLIACVYRASEWRHKAVELAAHELLQHLDKAAGLA